MELHSLTATTRDSRGKGAARQSRRDGLLPAVLYGGRQDPVSLQLDRRELERLLQGRSGDQAVVQLEVSDQPDLGSPALLKSLQHHPLDGHILHADFLRIRLDERIVTIVPIEVHGRPEGVQEGGMLDHQLRELEVECLALEVPEQITVDVSGLALGESIHVADLDVPGNITVITDPDRAVATVLIPRAVKTEEEEEAEGAEGEEAEGEEGAEEAEGEE